MESSRRARDDKYGRPGAETAALSSDDDVAVRSGLIGRRGRTVGQREGQGETTVGARR